MTVELRYESWSLRVGLVVSLTSYLLLIVMVVAGVLRRRSVKTPTDDAS